MTRFGVFTVNIERRNQIIDMVTQQRAVKNAELMERFGISIETVRRDLEYLEQQGVLRRVYGGAVVNTSLNSEPEYANRSKARFKEKTAIAAEAVKLIEPGDAVYLGVGTTVQAMVPYINSAGKITVFTNALRTAVELSELHDCTVVLPGGSLRPKELSLSGFPAEDNFKSFNVDKAFIGIGGITEAGITDFHIDEATIHRQMICNARQSIVLTDSGKFGLRGVVNLCALGEIDIVVTDSGAPKWAVKALEQSGVKVIIAKDK